ncbi:MAG TPA: hypothetical protein PKY50_18275 [Candidatus Competibacter sp.]|nr:hypothetical protein [Candidatus Competibacter sp.]
MKKIDEKRQNFRGKPVSERKKAIGRRWRGWLAVLLALSAPALAARPATLESLFRDSQGRDYQPPSPDELRQAEQLFQRAFAGQVETADWAALGFQVERLTEQGGVLTVIRESPDQRRGRGFYAFAAPLAGAPILQAPHALSDRYTGIIAVKLFASGRFAAGAWSTAPRAYQDDDEDVDADMAHRPDSYFVAFSRAAAVSRPAGAVIQLHGFAAEKRKTGAGRKAGAIVSASQRQPTPAAEGIARCLGGAFAEPVLLYPLQVKELGGLTNQIAQTLRMLGHSGFVHLELAQPLREQLHRDAEARQRFGTCLAGARP